MIKAVLASSGTGNVISAAVPIATGKRGMAVAPNTPTATVDQPN
eukprot:CAMPEP_0172682286 /NCGR_PEP_ID=MMETSP1074-20121228/18063_1 /TAXON_ID=2916 /ORGANISM="Ceratium fusus, Strain PA161109" /LENGTH=43 /DNA_ID= /DNA_START= /DNA_END= /DNA_ORIENTATION=